MDMREAGRGHTRWGLVLPFLAAPVVVLGLLVAGFTLWAYSEEDDAARTGAAVAVPCSEALAFGAAERPEDSDVRDCSVQRGIDTAYTAVLRMPREDVGGWLRATYPDAPKPRSGGTCGALCLDVTAETGLPGTAEAHVVQVRVAYENAETARVRFSAFTM
ncbi:hypothetical protein ACIF9R_21515 [Streptomyces sp. NPDC086080]|uniref:hypothetical protein n=1 Tax=Streptomyces sp. NPDC086080 TaxID=3365748 RepID=UPI0037D4D34C